MKINKDGKPPPAAKSALALALGFLREKTSLLAAVVLFIAVCWTYWPALQNDFINYDDSDYVIQNWHIQKGLNWQTFVWAFTSTAAANWHPLTWLSHMVDCQLFGLKPWGHHLTSILFHAVNTALLFFVLRRMTGATWRSAIAAAFFGFHPLRVESVAWVAERKDVLSAFFFLLTLWAYVRYVEQLKTADGAETHPSRFTFHILVAMKSDVGGSRWYLLTLFLFVLGLMSKPMLVTLPCAMLLLDYWPLRRFELSAKALRNSLPGTILEKIPFFVAALVVSGVTYVVQKQGGAVSVGLPWSGRLDNAVVSYCRYLGKLFWPADLAVFYPAVPHWPLVTVAGASALLIAISLLAILFARQRPYLLVGWLWFLGILVPVIGLVPVGQQSMADRYSYLPSIGILLAVVWGARALLGSEQSKVIGLYAVAGAIALDCSIVSRRQVRYWKDSETLFAHTLSVTGSNYVAYVRLAAVSEKQGRSDEAIERYTQALRLNPGAAEAHNNIGILLAKQGRTADAEKEYLEALKLNANYADPHNNLGSLLDQAGRSDEAVREFKSALTIKPDYADAHYNMAIALGHQGRQDEASVEFLSAIAIQPDSPDAHNNLGVILEHRGQLAAAVEHYQAAIKLKPDYARAHFNLGVAFIRTGELEGATREFTTALQLKPDYSEARKNLEAVKEALRARSSSASRSKSGP